MSEQGSGGVWAYVGGASNVAGAENGGRGYNIVGGASGTSSWNAGGAIASTGGNTGTSGGNGTGNTSSSSGGSTSTGGSGGAPSVDCSAGDCRRVFVSSIAMPSGALGGVLEADATCQALVNARGLSGSFRAWISDSKSSPTSRFVRASVPYRLMNGITIANNWSDLTDGTLAHAIDVYENGATVPGPDPHEVWTGTSISGAMTRNDCRGWTTGAVGAEWGDVGLTNLTDRNWTQVYLQFCDRDNVHLYCFEQ